MPYIATAEGGRNPRAGMNGTEWRGMVNAERGRETPVLSETQGFADAIEQAREMAANENREAEV